MAKAKTTKKKKKKTKKRTAATKTAAEQTEESASTATATVDEPAEDVEAVENGELTEEESTHAKYERIKKGNLYLTDLQKLTVAELHEMAKREGLSEYLSLIHI